MGGDITNWNTAAVTTMASMFEGAAKFNKDITNWNTKLVESMASMFKGALLFDQDIQTQTDKWNTVAVKDMSNMFNGAAAFGAASNGKAGITNWNTAAVTTMASMFEGAAEFNFSIKTDTNKWKTAAVTDMSSMFKDAKKFNQNITNWDITDVTANGGNTANWMFTATNSDSSGTFATTNEPCASSEIIATALKWRKC